MGTKRETTPTPEPYRPRVTVQGDKLPRRFKADARTIDRTARRALLADVYFGGGSK